MPHVDEGTLHALLDGALRAEDPERADAVGAHLEGCADCRALLEDAAALRDRAASILADLAPDAARPDFQEVLARRDRAAADEAGAVEASGIGAAASGVGAAADGAPDAGRRALARRAVRTRRLAWAASFVLALGTGYIIGDRFGVLPDPGEPRPLAETAVDAAGPADDAAPGRQPELPQAQPRAQPLAEEAAAADPGAGRERQADARADAEADARVNARADAQATEPADAPAGGPARTRERPEASPEAGASQPVETQADRPAPPPAPEVAERREDVANMELSRRSMQPEALVVTGMAAGSDWRPAEVAEAGRLLRAPVLRLPDARILDVELRIVGDRVLVRSTQRLPGDILLTVVQATAGPQPGPVGAAAAKAAESFADVAEREQAGAAMDGDGVRTVEVAREGSVVAVTGPLPADALRRLAEAATPVPVP